MSCKAILLICNNYILTKHIYNYKIVKKIGTHCSTPEVPSGGGTGGGGGEGYSPNGKKMEIRKCLDDF